MDSKQKTDIYRFIETVCISCGKVCNIQAHNERMNYTRKFHFGDSADLSLENYISADEANRLFSDAPRVRCRVTYSDVIEKVEYFKYDIRRVDKLKLVEDNEADYSFKSADRSVLDRNFVLRENADDVLIVRNGRVTDTSIANVAFLKDNIWYTPQFPLLKGTRRRILLERCMIMESDIKAEDIHKFERVRLFNAMIDFGEIDLDVSSALIW